MDVNAVMKQHFIEWYSETFIDFSLTCASTHCSMCVIHVIKGFTYLLTYDNRIERELHSMHCHHRAADCLLLSPKKRLDLRTGGSGSRDHYDV